MNSCSLRNDVMVRRWLSGIYNKPELMLSLSFVFLIGIGTILLKLPFAVRSPISWLDALFTATSATCVTGLVVRDTAKDFTIFGQIVILILIELGALGIMTFAASLLVSLGKSVSSKQAVAVGEILDQESLKELIEVISFILKATLSIELVGAIILSGYWIFKTGHIIRSIYWGVFHSISAFCNAGFSLFSDSFTRWRSDAIIMVTMSLLIILGGVGFIVLRDVVQLLRKERKMLSVQTKIVVSLNVFLLLLGGFLILFIESGVSFSNLALKDRILAAVFHSVNARTAGFNSVPIGSLSDASLWVLMMLMYIGASSGSTGGGIKTNTVGVLLLSTWRYFWGYSDVVCSKRTIPSYIVNKAVAILVFSLIIISFAVGLLLYCEPGLGLRNLLFEAISAFGTVGLSTGITANLNAPAKVVIIFLMYVGRLGPLTLAMALLKRGRRLKIEYADCKVMVG